MTGSKTVPKKPKVAHGVVGAVSHTGRMPSLRGRPKGDNLLGMTGSEESGTSFSSIGNRYASLPCLKRALTSSLPGRQSHSFADDSRMIDGRTLELVYLAARPVNFYFVHLLRFSQTEAD